MTESRIAVVTGATQGLGLALVDGLAARLGPADLVLLTGRDADRAERAAASIGSTSARVQGRRLDVTDSAAVQALADDLRARHGGVDIVISNAAARMTPDLPPAAQIDQLIDTNNFGAHRMLRSFAPLLRPGGRLLVVASSFGTLGHLDPRLRPRFDDAHDLDAVDEVLRGWQAAVHDGTAEQLGWPAWPNIPSKVAQVAAVRAVAAARREHDLAADILLAATCPGLIDTDASRPWFEDMSQAQSPAAAAVALIELVLAHPVDPQLYGQLVRFGSVLPWDGEIAPESTAGARVRRSQH